jgi:hypothetical protein
MQSFRGYNKYRKLSNRYLAAREEIESNKSMSSDEADSLMENIKKKAMMLRESVDDETRKNLEHLIDWCNGSSYSHRIYLENKEFIVLTTKDTMKKYVVIKEDTIGKNHYLDACEYEDVIEHREAVLNNDYLTKIKVNLPTAIKVGELLQQVRENGEYTTLYGHKEMMTTWTLD